MKLKGRDILLATVSLAALTLPGAFAQTAPQQVAETPAPTAQTAAATDAIPEVVVFGAGETRQVQTLIASDMRDAAPGTSPLKLLIEMPGVNFNSADPFGAYEWSTRITVRGFNQTQMGFTLDDIPLGDMSYGNFNGLHISRALIDENLGRAVLSEGSGAIDVASSSNLGATVQFYSKDPLDKRGAELAQTFGSDQTYRTYVKLDSGLLDSGTKFYVSYAHQELQKWKGSGGNYVDQINAKLVQKIGDSTKVSLYFDYSDRQEIDYQDLTYGFLDRLGPSTDNYYPDYTRALNAAKGIFTGAFNGLPDAIDAAYYSASGLRTDYLGGAAVDTQITDNLRLKTTFYGHGDKGVGTWTTPYVGASVSPTGSPLRERTSEYGITREGIVSSAIYDIGNHTINAGIWYEHNDFDLARRYYDSPPNSPPDPYIMPDPSTAVFTRWAYAFTTDTVQLHLQDTWQITDDVTANFGVKTLNSESTGTPSIDNTGVPTASGTITAHNWFLPQAGVNWKVTPGDELFMDVAKNTRAYQLGGPSFSSPWGTANQAQFQFDQNTLKPETSWTYEAGYRFSRDIFEGAAVGYYTDFRNRLIFTAGGTGPAGAAGTLLNVGTVTTTGAELSGAVHPIEHVRFYNALSYNSSTYDSDYRNAFGLVPTRGKQVPDTPTWLFRSQLSYENQGFFSNLEMNYTSKRYITQTNDVAAEGYTIFNVGAGYSFGNIDFLEDVKLQMNVYNLFDRTYISTIGENGFPVNNADFVNNITGDFLIGAPRQFFVTLGAKF